MGSIISIDISGIPDKVNATVGEHELRCEACELKKSKQGEDMFETRWQVVDQPNAKNIFYYLMLPNGASQDMDKESGKKERYLNFLKAVAIDPSTQYNTDDITGKTIFAITKIDPANGDFAESASIQKIIKGA